ncbi:MAG: helix-turn-helix transcriptional regulator, partial [Planctomycetaceae bacterium]|nr:helix-turn-helix transcriptional regulator [Planctomycetaceae bacterium]
KSERNGSPISHLSERELEIFEWLGRGMTVKEIGRQLHLSPKTVEYHREHIKQKLNLSSSAAVVREATVWSINQ